MPPPIPIETLLTAYAHDIGKYEALREKHKDLADWIQRYCLGKTGAGAPESTASSSQ